jgi:chaperonin GroES
LNQKLKIIYMKKLEALFDAVIVKPIENEETLYGNIIVPDMGKEKNEFGEVVATGSGRYTLMGNHIPMQVKVGDLVVLPTQGFTKLPFDGVEYYVGPENQILAKVKKTITEAITETELTEEDEQNLTEL